MNYRKGNKVEPDEKDESPHKSKNPSLHEIEGNDKKGKGILSSQKSQKSAEVWFQTMKPQVEGNGFRTGDIKKPTTDIGNFETSLVKFDSC